MDREPVNVYDLRRSLKPARSARMLAGRMASLAALIRESISAAFARADAPQRLRELYRAFQETLTPTGGPTEFADVCAQTLACGLLAARLNHAGARPFGRYNAARELPSAHPFLRQLFEALSDPALTDEPFVLLIDELTRLLAVTDVDALMNNASAVMCAADPIGHFYELFLTRYDPGLRERRGVYATPAPLISYIVSSLDYLLRVRFACAAGLADAEMIVASTPDGESERVPRVLILDPATGAGTFLSHAFERIRSVYQANGDAEQWHVYVREQLGARLCGFEVLMAPYLMAQLKLGMQLAALDLPGAERAQWRCDDLAEELRPTIYLTNTLDEAARRSQMLFGRADGEQPGPIMVVLGNPPYAGHSANRDRWMNDLLASYKKGHPGLEKAAQTKWLSDDYVKFMRFAQWCVEQSGCGIVALITNHSYLDNPTFRGMRHSLLQCFDDLYILDLHGNSKKRERAPDGTKDENVFPIQTGVAIGIFVKEQRETGSALARVHHADLWGPRSLSAAQRRQRSAVSDGKFRWLSEHDLSTTAWTIVTPQAPFYLFTPQQNAFAREYEQGWPVPAIFQPNGDPAPGIVTTQDEFAISWTRAEAITKIESFVATRAEEEARALFRLCAQDQWQYAAARRELATEQWRDELVEVLYRPFDMRWTVFNRHVAVHRRTRVTRHLLAGENIALAIGRAGQVIEQDEWNILFCTRSITDFNLFRRGGNYLFPLYLYPDAAATPARENPSIDPAGRRVNLAGEFLDALSRRLHLSYEPADASDLQRTFGPIAVLHYIYAILHAPAYRARYAAFLKIDFPRVPLTSNPALFHELCHLGERLVGLHLMERMGESAARFPVSGNNLVEKIRYTRAMHEPDLGRVWINKTQYFEGVPPEVWTLRIGGYQVCERWLKARSGRRLTLHDIQCYQCMVAALCETLELMKQIDALIESYGGWPLV